VINETNGAADPDKAEEDLQSSEIRYRRLFESARDGILILDVTSRRITDVNPFMIELLGYSRDEFLGKELWEIGLFKDKDQSQRAFRELQATGYIRYEDMPLETKEGERREVEFVSNVYQEDSRQVIQCNIRDNTEHKRAQQRLQESEDKQHQLSERQAAIFDALPAHICLLCGLGNVLEVNKSWRYFALANGYSGEDFGVGSNYIEVCENANGHCTAGAKEIAEGIRSVLSGKTRHFELEYPCHSPEENRWFRLTVTPLQEDASAGAVVMHVNVTERKLFEKR
jgi:PAS domain S-box-containing protein